MNREIVFRGRDSHGNWHFGNLLCRRYESPVPETTQEYEEYYIQEQDFSGGGTEVDVKTVGQYTGLKDKSGKEIYEGDILRFQVPDGTVRHFVIEWADEDRILRPLSDFVPDGNPIRISGWCFNWRGYRLYPTVIDGVPDNEVMEIVGNIHDNPELLKQQRQ